MGIVRGSDQVRPQGAVGATAAPKGEIHAMLGHESAKRPKPREPSPPTPLGMLVHALSDTFRRCSAPRGTAERPESTRMCQTRPL
eukprot:13278692-Alexandrium_andersonii.AAC.1